jgi:pimeloyl-ACP methyl ester carboxylesterase
VDTAPSSGSLDVGSGADRRSIQYLTRAGNAPGVFWMSGFKSEMRSTKASFLDEWAACRGQAYTRFDYSGHGLSAGRFEDGTLSRWLEEAVAVFDHVTEGPQVVVGSSMGGYLALLMACHFLARTSTLEDGVWMRPSRYEDGPYPITRALIEDGRTHLMASTPWNPGCPVEILQGAKDPDVPYEHVRRLADLLIDVPVTLNVVPEGEHRLSEPEDLALLATRIEHLLETQ